MICSVPLDINFYQRHVHVHSIHTRFVNKGGYRSKTCGSLSNSYKILVGLFHVLLHVYILSLGGVFCAAAK